MKENQPHKQYAATMVRMDHSIAAILLFVGKLYVVLKLTNAASIRSIKSRVSKEIMFHNYTAIYVIISKYSVKDINTISLVSAEEQRKANKCAILLLQFSESTLTETILSYT